MRTQFIPCVTSLICFLPVTLLYLSVIMHPRKSGQILSKNLPINFLVTLLYCMHFILFFVLIFCALLGFFQGIHIHITLKPLTELRNANFKIDFLEAKIPRQQNFGKKRKCKCFFGEGKPTKKILDQGNSDLPLPAVVLC